VPVLDDGDLRIWESDLIVDYLLRTYPAANCVWETAGAPPLAPWLARADRHWQDMMLLSTIATCADSIVNLRLMRPDGITPDNSDYLARQRTRVERCLDWLETQVTDEGFAPGWLSIMDIAFVCPMAFCEKREVMIWRGRPKLDALYERTIQRPSFAKTPLNELPFRERYVVTRTLIAK
jgi:glutathione S-transferase